MSSPPIAQGIVSALDQAQLALVARIGGYLTAWGTGAGISLPVPRSYWRGELIPNDFVTPGIGMVVQSTDYADFAAEGRWRVIHTVNFVVVFRDGELTTTDRIDETRMDEAVQIYTTAIAQCLETYLPTAAFGGSVGVFDCVPAGSAATVIETDERDVYMRAASVAIQIHQMVRGRIGAPP
jgi:hypothetical protein